MKKPMYAVFDQASAVHMQPFLQHSDAEARRTFIDWVSNPETPISAHPEHYTLVRLGQYDDQKGQIIPEDQESIITGLVAKSESQTVDKQKVAQLNSKISAGGTA